MFEGKNARSKTRNWPAHLDEVSVLVLVVVVGFVSTDCVSCFSASFPKTFISSAGTTAYYISSIDLF